MKQNEILKQDAARLREQGWIIRDIVKQTGLSRATIMRFFNKKGLTNDILSQSHKDIETPSETPVKSDTKNTKTVDNTLLTKHTSGARMPKGIKVSENDIVSEVTEDTINTTENNMLFTQKSGVNYEKNAIVLYADKDDIPEDKRQNDDPEEGRSEIIPATSEPPITQINNPALIPKSTNSIMDRFEENKTLVGFAIPIGLALAGWLWKSGKFKSDKKDSESDW